ncbi:MAG: LLM class flavin-dependent oxidoreductase [Solirubrobacteraceae bacterium]
MEISCAFAPSLKTPEHVALAEQLGYARAWCFDSPALFSDPWMALARAADRTTTIGLGPAVLVPSLRHPMVVASCTATLAMQAPGRVTIGIGAGFSARLAIGQRPMRWADVSAYIVAVRRLLAGEEVEWKGGVMRMLQPPGVAQPRPIDVPLVVGADGPRGFAVAGQLGDGLFTVVAHEHEGAEHARRILLQAGTVLDEREDPACARVIAAAGHGVAVVYHAVYEKGGRTAVSELPAGEVWADAIESTPAEVRHLAIHEGHLLEPNPHDRVAWRAGAADALELLTLSGTRDQVAARLHGYREAGFSEVSYQPAGPEIPRELKAFADAAGLSG